MLLIHLTHDNVCVIMLSKEGVRLLYEIIFYSDKDGYSQLLEYIADLERRTDKDSRIKLKKIHEYITMLASSGTLLPANIAKHLEGEI